MSTAGLAPWAQLLPLIIAVHQADGSVSEDLIALPRSSYLSDIPAPVRAPSTTGVDLASVFYVARVLDVALDPGAPLGANIDAVERSAQRLLACRKTPRVVHLHTVSPLTPRAFSLTASDSKHLLLHALKQSVCMRYGDASPFLGCSAAEQDAFADGVRRGEASLALPVLKRCGLFEGDTVVAATLRPVIAVRFVFIRTEGGERAVCMSQSKVESSAIFRTAVLKQIEKVGLPPPTSVLVQGCTFTDTEFSGVVGGEWFRLLHFPDGFVYVAA